MKGEPVAVRAPVRMGGAALRAAEEDDRVARLLRRVGELGIRIVSTEGKEEKKQGFISKSAQVNAFIDGVNHKYHMMHISYVYIYSISLNTSENSKDSRP